MTKEVISDKDCKSPCPCAKSCPLGDTISVIGGKWKIPILCIISFYESVRYNALQRQVKGITNTMLALSLRELEKDGMIKRVQYEQMPVRVEYSLTEKGKSILPVLERIREWGINNLSEAIE